MTRGVSIVVGVVAILLLAFVLLARRRGKSPYELLDATPTIPDVVQSWHSGGVALETARFVHAYDFTCTSRRTENFIRLMQRDGRLFALLHYVVVNGQRYTYTELLSITTAGVVFTNNSKYSDGADRPPEYPLYRVEPGTAIVELLRVHESNLAIHDRRGEKLVAIHPDHVLQRLTEVDKAVATFRKTGSTSSPGTSRTSDKTF